MKKQMNRQVVSTVQYEDWVNIIKGFHADIYYMPEYLTAFEKIGDGKGYLFFFDQNNMQALNVFFKRDVADADSLRGKIPTNTYFDITTPYGYGGFLLKGNITDENISLLRSEFCSWCEQENIISEFVRFHPILDNAKKIHSLYQKKYLGKTITIDLTEKENIFNNFSSSNRRAIRKAVKNEISIYCGRNKELYEEFKKIYTLTMQRDFAQNYYFFNDIFFESILEDLRYNSLIFYAQREEKIISMAIILFFGSAMHYHFSGALKEFNCFRPSNLLLYEVALWGHANGFKTFHLGGGLGSKEDSLFAFKKTFNNKPAHEFYIGKKIFNQDVYDKLVQLSNIVSNDPENDYFPLYRKPIC